MFRAHLRIKPGQLESDSFGLRAQREIYYQVFYGELTQVLDNSNISTAFFCTTGTSTPGQTSPPDNNTASQENIPKKVTKTGAVDTTKPLGTGIKFLPGRPDIRGTAMSEARAAQESSTRLAVLACGPSQMADECRQSVHEVMRGGFQEIEYYEEAFGW